MSLMGDNPTVSEGYAFVSNLLPPVEISLRGSSSEGHGEWLGGYKKWLPI
jgi:hypothetical protein